MSRLRVRVKNRLYDKRHLYGYHITEYNEYEGMIVPNPKWVKDDSFCLATGQHPFDFRVIEKDMIMCGWYWAEGSENKSIKPQRSNTKIVDGTNGKKYILTRNGNKWACNCTGYSYRKTCSHVKEA